MEDARHHTLFFTVDYRLAHEAVTAQQSNSYCFDLMGLVLAGRDMRVFIVRPGDLLPCSFTPPPAS